MDYVAVGDFSFYDQMLDTSAMVGAIPARYRVSAAITVDFDTYFAMARGSAARRDGDDQVVRHELPLYRSRVHAGHVISRPQRKDGRANPRGDRPGLYPEARPHRSTHVSCGSAKSAGKRQAISRAFAARAGCLPIYEDVLRQLNELGVRWVQIDEPALVADLPEAWLEAYQQDVRGAGAARVAVLLATYFGVG